MTGAGTILPGYKRKPFSFFLKQVSDYAGAALLLTLFLPAMAIIAVLIKLDTRGPALFRQTRAGRFDKLFSIYKFRTMVVGAEKISLEIFKDDPRITRVGRFLRITSLDELPQLINILRGEMSLIGPRPLLPNTVRPEERRRQNMKPGLTSFPVLFGRHELDRDKRMRLDVWYVDHWSLRLDLQILLKTIPHIVSRKNLGKSRFRPGSLPVPPLDDGTTR
jgi:lipopolysaccharide/colanic/teichoic acid biosynthesis glycosyltransferase